MIPHVAKSSHFAVAVFVCGPVRPVGNVDSLDSRRALRDQYLYIFIGIIVFSYYGACVRKREESTRVRVLSTNGWNGKTLDDVPGFGRSWENIEWQVTSCLSQFGNAGEGMGTHLLAWSRASERDTSEHERQLARISEQHAPHKIWLTRVSEFNSRKLRLFRLFSKYLRTIYFKYTLNYIARETVGSIPVWHTFQMNIGLDFCFIMAYLTDFINTYNLYNSVGNLR